MKLGAMLLTSCCKILYDLGMGLRNRTQVPHSIRLEEWSYNQADVKTTGWESAREAALLGYPVIQGHFLGYPFTILGKGYSQDKDAFQMFLELDF